MVLSRAQVGSLYLASAALLFAYYTVWVLGLPFLPPSLHWVKAKFFPPVELALGFPAALGTAVFVLLWARTYYLVREDRKND